MAIYSFHEYDAGVNLTIYFNYTPVVQVFVFPPIEEDSDDNESDVLQKLKEKGETRERAEDNSEPEFTDILELEAPLPQVCISRNEYRKLHF